MVSYATVADVEARLGHEVANVEACEALLEDAVLIIDSYNKFADDDVKKTVACRMVIRAVGTVGDDTPIGANQGTISALGYSQTWTMSGGAVGELYLSKMDKKLLGCGDRIGSSNPLGGVMSCME